MNDASKRIVLLATAIVIVARFVAMALGGVPNENPLLVDHDLPHYATILVDAEDGVDFERDPIFAGRTELVWRGAFLYMAFFRLLYWIAGDFGRALDLFQLLLVAIYFPAMVAWLRSVGANVLVAAGVAGISLAGSSFLVTGTRWGIFTPVVPLVLCTAVAPLIAVIAMRLILRGGALRAFAAATIVSLPVLLINPATGLALIELAVLLLVCAAWRGAISWRAVVVFGVTAGMWVVAAWMNIRVASAGFSFADAAEMIRYGQDQVMVFPFRAALREPVIGVILGAHAVLSIVLYLSRSNRHALLWLVVVQAVYAVILLRSGWLMLLPLAVAIDRIRRERFDATDRWLWGALAAALVIGPLQQTALLFLWERWRIEGLTALVFEGARFFQFSYFIVFALVARAVQAIQEAFTAAWARVLVVAFVVYGAYLNLDVSPFSMRVGMLWIGAVSILWLTRDRWLPWFGLDLDGRRWVTAAVFAGLVAVGLTAILFLLDLVTLRIPVAAAGCALLLLVAMAESRHDFRAFLAACVLTAVIGGPWMLLLLMEPVRSRSGVLHETLYFAMKLPRAERNRAAGVSGCGPLDENYRAVTHYAKTRLPSMSVFHVLTFDRSFRAYAGRPMLPVSDEWLIPIYDGAPVTRLRQESVALWNARNDLSASRALAKRYGADYLVACGAPDGAPLYVRGPYAIYSLK